jgi:hypothetical protein
MTTHGTRSAYNHGCRCDACGEAARLARARQRAVHRADIGHPPEVDDYVRLGTGPITVIALAAGGVLVWRARNLRRQDEQPHAGLLLGGVALLVAGLILAASCWPTEGK